MQAIPPSPAGSLPGPVKLDRGGCEGSGGCLPMNFFDTWYKGSGAMSYCPGALVTGDTTASGRPAAAQPSVPSGYQITDV